MSIRDLPAAARALLERLTRSPLLRDAAATTMWNAVGKAVGFLIPVAIAAWYGVSAGTDAFFFSYGALVFLTVIFSVVAQAAIVPFVSEIRTGGRERTEPFVAEVFFSATLVVVVALAALLLVLKPLLPLVTNFQGEGLRLTYVLLLETAPLVVLVTWTSVVTGVMDAYKRFALPAVSPAFRGVVAIAFIFAFRGKLGLHAVPAGYVAGEAVRVVVLGWCALRMLPLRFAAADLKPRLSPRLRSFLRVAARQNLGHLALALNPVVDRIMASWLPAGAVSVLYYADRLYLIPMSLVLSGVLAVVRSHWSEDHYGPGGQQLGGRVALALRVGTVPTIAVAVALILLSQPLVRLAFARGEFPPDRVSAVAAAWRLYLVGLPPHVLGLLYVQAFLVLKDTRTTMLVSLLMGGLNVALNYALMWKLGVAGIALSSSLTSLFALLFLRWRFRAKGL